jgi:hypothetical protein
MVMIPMECPKCGRRGSVPSTRLNSPFNCKSCNAPFYLNTAGDAVSGEPPQAVDPRGRKGATATQAKAKKGESGVSLGDMLSGIGDMSSAERTKKLGMVAVLLAFIAAMYYFVTMPRTDPLLERGAYLTKAFLDNDEVRVRGVATPDTEEDAALWLEKGRAMNGMKGSSSDFTYDTGIMSGGLKQGGAELMATLTARGPAAVVSADKAPGGPAFQMLTVTMFFIPDQQGQWRLDGRQSLSALTSQMKAQQRALGKAAGK